MRCLNFSFSTGNRVVKPPLLLNWFFEEYWKPCISFRGVFFTEELLPLLLRILAGRILRSLHINGWLQENLATYSHDVPSQVLLLVVRRVSAY